MGPYPLFTCERWTELESDLDELGESVVSVVLVADPLAGVAPGRLERAFPDLVAPFNPHIVRDLDAPAAMPAHHRRHLRRASRAVEVEVCREPLEHLDDWNRLYAALIARHDLAGIRAFSSETFRRQLAIPGMVMVRASRHDVTLSLGLWFEDAPHAYYHLGASSPEGYAVSASYAIFAAAFDHLRAAGVRCVDLGGSAAGAQDGGLLRFKRGWGNVERTAWLFGRIFDRRAYSRLAERSEAASSWFPAYRAFERDLSGTPESTARWVPTR